MFEFKRWAQIFKSIFVFIIVVIWIFSGWLPIWKNLPIPFAFAAIHGYSRSPSGFTVASSTTFNFSVDDISDICGSPPSLPVAKYWWVFVNSSSRGSFYSQTFASADLSVNAQISLPALSDYYEVGTMCSDNTIDPNENNPNDNFWSHGSVLDFEGDGNQPFEPIFNVQNAE